MKKVFLIFVSLSVFAVSCSFLKQISDTIANLQKLQFKLDNVTNFRLAGIDLNRINSLSDFSITDGLKLTNAYATKSFPADFTINVNAKNPNDGSKSGTKATSATIAGLDYRILLDDVQTISGDISAPITVPGTGQTVNIPLRASMDLYKFFGSKGYESVINLALALGGVQSSPSRVKIDAQPTVTTQIGRISYPGRLTIIDKEWR